MTPLEILKRRQTRTLQAIVRRVRSQRRLHRHVPTEDQFVAAAAAAIIRNRRKRR